MRLSVLKARVLWFMDIQELNPRGRSLFPEVVDALESKYDFQRVPKSASDLSKEGGIELVQGSFEVRPNEFIDVNFTVFNDGVMADTRSSTKDSEAFLGDLFDFLAKGTFGIEYSPDLIRKKACISEILIQTEKSLHTINPNLSKFANRLNELSGGKYPQFDISGVIFRTDQTVPFPPAPFQFERRVGVSFSENRYYSQAPFDTDEHRALLQEFESLFLG